VTFKDKNGNPINIGDTVIIDGHAFDVEINPFTNEVVVDGETGQVLLKDVHEICEVCNDEDYIIALRDGD